jgi:hypothetical protein
VRRVRLIATSITGLRPAPDVPHAPANSRHPEVTPTSGSNGLTSFSALLQTTSSACHLIF